MWSSQSQPDMALIGVKSVLSPRPFSAPHNMESFSIMRHNASMARRRVNGTDDFESDSYQSSETAYELDSEQAESFIERDSLSSEEVASKISVDQSKASTVYGSFDYTVGTEGSIGDIDCGQDASSFNAANCLNESFFHDDTEGRDEDRVPPGIHKLVNLNSKDSAFESSLEQKSPSPNDHEACLLSEEALDEAETPCLSESESNDSQDEHLKLDEENPSLDNIKDASLPFNEEETIDRALGSTLDSSALIEKNFSNREHHEKILIQSQASYRRPLIPPSIVTFDLSTDREEVLVKPVENLQETVDMKLLDAQKTGHLDLANIGLPFIPSAILLSESSMIHRVSLQDNGLVELPGAAMEHLSCVTWLDLRYNELRALPPEISELGRLQVLLLQGNRLTALPVVLGTLTDITTLQVSDNPLTFPPQDVINGGTRAILSFLKSKCQNGDTPTCLSSSLANRRTSASSAPDKRGEEEGGGEEAERRGENPQGNHMLGTSSYTSRLRRNLGQRSHSSENVEEIKDDWEDVPEDGKSGEEEEEEEEEKEEEEENELWDSDSDEEADISEMEETAQDRARGEYHYRRKLQNRSSSTSTTSGCVRYHSASSNSLQIAIRDGRDGSDLHLLLSREALDSGRDTLGRPPSPNSACLLTPNIEFPKRPQYDLTADQNLEDECPFKDDNCPSWTCDCFKNSSPFSRDKMKVINKMPEESIRQRLLKNMTPSQGQFNPHQCSMFNEPQGRDSAAHRRSLHLRLQKDNIEIEDDLESLEGDIGEGYRRPHSEPVGDKEKECHRQMSAETVLPLPVVSLQLPSPRDLRAGCSGKRCRRPPRRTGDGFRKSKQGLATRMNNRDTQKSKLVTVSEVHRRAREERRRQREKLAATREMVAMQRLKSAEELDAWRDEAREMQLSQQQYYSLHPDLFLRAVCEAPFAVDGTTLTPRARAKMKPKDHKRSSSPSVSDVSGVCAGVRKCLDELSQSSKGINSKHDVAGGGGPLSHTASLVHQLSHLRRQLNRLRVNYVI